MTQMGVLIYPHRTVGRTEVQRGRVSGPRIPAEWLQGEPLPEPEAGVSPTQGWRSWRSPFLDNSRTTGCSSPLPMGPTAAWILETGAGPSSWAAGTELTGQSKHLLCFVLFLLINAYISRGFPTDSDGKESACNAGDQGSNPGTERPPGEGNDNPLQYSCLENPMDTGAWRATVCGVAESRTRLSH